MIKQFQPHDVPGVSEWVKRAGTRYMRMLAFMPVKKTYVLCAYSCREPEPELEAEITHEGGKLIGYYASTSEPMRMLSDIAATWEELHD